MPCRGAARPQPSGACKEKRHGQFRAFRSLPAQQPVGHVLPRANGHGSVHHGAAVLLENYKLTVCMDSKHIVTTPSITHGVSLIHNQQLQHHHFQTRPIALSYMGELKFAVEAASDYMCPTLSVR